MGKALIKVSDKDNPVIQNCITKLKESPSKKKEIANELGISLDLVHKIAQTYLSGSQHVIVTSAKELELEQETKQEKVFVISPDVNYHGKGKKLTEDEILNILEDLESGMKYCEIAEKYNVSHNTIAKYKKQYDVHTPNEKKRREMISKVDEEVFDEDDHSSSNQNYVPQRVLMGAKYTEVALIADRHPFPSSVTDAIFKEAIPGDKMFDYTWYDAEVMNFIVHNMDMKDGFFTTTLVVYITGLPAAAASVIKVCNKMGVNLVFRHYNHETKGYENQIIFDQFEIADQYPSLGKYFDNKEILCADCTIEEVLSAKKDAYIIQTQEFDNNNNMRSEVLTLIKDYDNIWKFLPKAIDLINSQKGKKRMGVFVTAITYSDYHAGFKFTNGAITKSYNFK